MVYVQRGGSFTKRRKYLTGSMLVWISLVVVLAFNVFLFPSLLSEGIDESLEGTYLSKSEIVPVVGVKEKSNGSLALGGLQLNYLSWNRLTQYESMKHFPIQRNSKFKETRVQASNLEPKIAEALLTPQEVIARIKARVSNLQECNNFSYTIQLCKTQIPDVPYRYNVILGESKRMKQIYNKAEIFASYYEVTTSFVPLKGSISLGEVNYIQMNAITGDILVLLSA